MDVDAFREDAPGGLVPIHGMDSVHGPWTHHAFVPLPLPTVSPDLDGRTYRAVADARAALAALDSTARRLPDPRLFRRPSLQAEAQSTSALEGTYAPLSDVLVADRDRPPNQDLREILNYVAVAEHAFGWVEDGRPLTVGLLGDLQGRLVRGTVHDDDTAGRIREHQVVIGRRLDARPDELPVRKARFVPPPPGLDLRAGLQALLQWMDAAPRDIDPVVAAALAHYQFETLHPFADGNGRIGRLVIVLHLLQREVLLEPTLTVSPWFEARRTDYYDHLFAVSSANDWNAYVSFFARGLEASARDTHARMLALVDVQEAMKETVRRSKLRADTAHLLIDFALAHVSFTVRDAERELPIAYGRVNALVSQLADLGLLVSIESGVARRFYAPDVYDVLVGAGSPTRSRS